MVGRKKLRTNKGQKMTNSEVCAAFLDRKLNRKKEPKANSSNKNLSYEDNRLYSYSSLLATIDRVKGHIIIYGDTAEYSVTSATHKTRLLKCINTSIYKVWYIPNMYAKSAIHSYILFILDYALKIQGARSRKAAYVNTAKACIKEAKEYIDGYVDNNESRYIDILNELEQAIDNNTLWNIPISNTIDVQALTQEIN